MASLHPPDSPVAATRLLVVGYGNTLRSDDGVGPKAAESVRALGLPGVEVLACPQLTPEIAEPVSRATAVVFVDAAADAAAGIRLRRLRPGPSPQLMAHAASPEIVLAIAREVFGRAPRAWWLTIPARRLGFGEELSPAASSGLAQAVKKIGRLSSLLA